MAKPSDDEEEFDGFVATDIYEKREFDTWRKTINLRTFHEFEEQVGLVFIPKMYLKLS